MSNSGVALPAPFAFVFALGIATAASAQFVRFDEHQKRLDEARQLLARSDAQSIAWGAFNVASYQLPGLTKELTAALDRVTADDGAGSFAVNALLDAVVQTHAAVPAVTLDRSSSSSAIASSSRNWLGPTD